MVPSLDISSGFRIYINHHWSSTTPKLDLHHYSSAGPNIQPRQLEQSPEPVNLRLRFIQWKPWRRLALDFDEAYRAQGVQIATFVSAIP